MINLFIDIRFLDILDIALVALFFSQIYRLIRGTVALNIFLGIFLLFLFYIIVKALNMNMLGGILESFISIGAIAVLIVFQQEIRRFLLLLGTRYKFSRNFSLNFFLKENTKILTLESIDEIVRACENMKTNKTGALIVVAIESELGFITQTGLILEAKISTDLLENIFFKNAPLHDGALIITHNIIKAVRCILPVSDKQNIPSHLGMRHRAAIGISQESNALTIIVSEETGKFSYALNGRLKHDIKTIQLRNILISSTRKK